MDCCDGKQQVSDAKKFDKGSLSGIILIGHKGKYIESGGSGG